METLRDAMVKFKASVVAPSLVEDWRSYVPAGSRWRPGDLGSPDCPYCLGVGYVSAGVPVGNPLFGKLYICECAAEGLRVAQTRQLQEASALSTDDLALMWGSVSATDGASRGLTAVKATISLGYGWCYLWGPPGPGKTTMLKAAVAESIRAGQAAVFVNWADLLQHLRGGYDAGNYDERVERWRSVPVLAVDEYGRAHETDWVREAQARVFNHRYESAIGRKTVTLFASNYPPERGDEWFTDRLRDGRFRVEEVAGPSMRPLME